MPRDHDRSRLVMSFCFVSVHFTACFLALFVFPSVCPPSGLTQAERSLTRSHRSAGILRTWDRALQREKREMGTPGRREHSSHGRRTKKIPRHMSAFGFGHLPKLLMLLCQQLLWPLLLPQLKLLQSSSDVGPMIMSSFSILWRVLWC